MSQFFFENGEVILSLLLALGLGMVIGAERVFVHKEAGMKTHSLVSMGAALFIIVSETVAAKYANFGDFDPMRVASQVVVGIGFLGAGIIMFQNNRLRGLTTAGGLWVTAGIGMAAGFQLYALATITTFFVLCVFVLMNIVEKPIKRFVANTADREDML